MKTSSTEKPATASRDTGARIGLGLALGVIAGLLSPRRPVAAGLAAAAAAGLAASASWRRAKDGCNGKDAGDGNDVIQVEASPVAPMPAVADITDVLQSISAEVGEAAELTLPEIDHTSALAPVPVPAPLADLVAEIPDVTASGDGAPAAVVVSRLPAAEEGGIQRASIKVVPRAIHQPRTDAAGDAAAPSDAPDARADEPAAEDVSRARRSSWLTWWR